MENWCTSRLDIGRLSFLSSENFEYEDEIADAAELGSKIRFASGSALVQGIEADGRWLLSDNIMLTGALELRYRFGSLRLGARALDHRMTDVVNS